MASLARNKVYESFPGRRFDVDGTSQVDDVIGVGLYILTKGEATSPLANHNNSFLNLQAAYRVTPLVGISSSALEATSRAAEVAPAIVDRGAQKCTAHVRCVLTDSSAFPSGSPSLAAAIDEVMDRPHIELHNNDNDAWLAMELEALADFADNDNEDPYAPDIDGEWGLVDGDDEMLNKDTGFEDDGVEENDVLMEDEGAGDRSSPSSTRSPRPNIVFMRYFVYPTMCSSCAWFPPPDQD
ncbi:uncharacterized protein SCHCODRAFT_02314939 [Schizophyllum commune H4-8]|uniref:uncharacterized protein n=1 Tax=Schizophyllum commune (strain H4-8 / FGSC 9210) TaxID=578458 RepID=UPI0021603C94|nr:uncharacterized protein SCHCODRAFT_02314939 [Schizophyllum commune H4-8]KAI5891294.1 hypothetical protein SCHCODRAFT_02314939 [Schizophyllum commune H4-8]